MKLLWYFTSLAPEMPEEAVTRMIKEAVSAPYEHNYLDHYISTQSERRLTDAQLDILIDNCSVQAPLIKLLQGWGNYKYFNTSHISKMISGSNCLEKIDILDDGDITGATILETYLLYSTLDFREEDLLYDMSDLESTDFSYAYYNAQMIDKFHRQVQRRNLAVDMDWKNMFFKKNRGLTVWREFEPTVHRLDSLLLEQKMRMLELGIIDPVYMYRYLKERGAKYKDWLNVLDTYRQKSNLEHLTAAKKQPVNKI